MEMENTQTTKQETTPNLLLEHSKKLSEMGFGNSTRNLKLLKRTHGDFETVLSFLQARERLHKTMKKDKKEKKPCTKPRCLERKAKKEAKLLEKLERKEKKKLDREQRKLEKNEKNEQKEEEMNVESKKEIEEISNVQDEKKKEKKEKKEKKNLSKEEKLKEKLERKEKKKIDREQRKLEKKEKKEKKEKHEKVKQDLPNVISIREGFPKEVSHLILDGNNMLYVCAPIRQLVIRRHFGQAEELLSELARQVSKALGIYCVVLFDSLHSKSVEEEKFQVSSARPSFPTSDDLLVKWAQERFPSSNTESKALFITSDVGLIQRLATAENQVCKPKEWFVFALNLLGFASDSLDKNMENWISQNSTSDLSNAVKDLTIQN